MKKSKQRHQSPIVDSAITEIHVSSLTTEIPHRNKSPYQVIRDKVASEHYNVRDEYKKNTPELNRKIQKNESLPFAIGALNITGSLNIGMMIRTAALVGAEAFYVIGRKAYDKRSTVGADNYIRMEYYDNYDDFAFDIAMGSTYRISLVEQGGDPLPMFHGEWESIYGDGRHPLFLFGSESHGIPEEIVNNHLGPSFSIPQMGVLRSFNVASAMSIVSWEYSKNMRF